ncbi:MAG: WG repeat-containing protein [Lewinellaceae bacterium]|nr:WG repeat-containing protein [Saprospiraceae bacterium]MCB9333099.1 WG repeat-containing protein [Lewinellaceae bacterium]
MTNSNFDWIKFAFVFACILFAYNGAAQAPCHSYSCAIERAQKALGAKKYQEAFEQLESAEGYRDSDKEEVRQLRTALFLAVEEEKRKAQQSEQRARQELAKSNRLVAFFNFGTENVAWAYNDSVGRFAVITKDGYRLTDFLYEVPSTFQNGVAITSVENEYVFVNEAGVETTKRYPLLEPFVNGHYLAEDAESPMLIDQKGNERFRVYLSGGGILVMKDSLFGIMDGDLNFVVPLRDDVDITYSVEGLIAVRKNSFYGLCDTNWNWIVPPEYDRFSRFNDSLIYAKKGADLFFLKRNGDVFRTFTGFTRGYIMQEGHYLGHSLPDTFLTVLDIYSQDTVFQRNFLKDVPDDLATRYWKAVLEYQYDDQKVGDWAVLKVADKYGFVKMDGSIAIPFDFDDAEQFSEGLAPVKKGDSWGFIDTSGKTAIPFIYDEVGEFVNHLAVVEKDSFKGVIDNRGSTVIPLIYNSIIPQLGNRYFTAQTTKELCFFKAELKIMSVPAAEDTYGGFFNKNIVMISKVNDNVGLLVDVVFDEIASTDSLQCFSKSLLKSRQRGYWDVFDQEGIRISALQLDTIQSLQNGVAPVRKGTSWGALDASGKLIIPLEYDSLCAPEEQLIRVKKDGFWGCLDKNNRKVIPFEYNEIGPFVNGLARVIYQYKRGFIDAQNNFVVPATYQGARDFEQGIAPVYQQGKWGAINRQGKLVLPAEYSGVDPCSEGLFGIYKNGKWGFADTLGTIKIAPEYTAVQPFSEGFSGVYQNGYWGFIDKKGTRLAPNVGYSLVQPFSAGFAPVKETWWGLIDKSGNQVLPTNYPVMVQIPPHYILAKHPERDGGGWDVIDLVGKQHISKVTLDTIGTNKWALNLNGKHGLFAPDKLVLIPPVYEQIGRFVEETGWVKVQQNGKWGWVDKRGKQMLPCKYTLASQFHNGQAFVVFSYGEKTSEYWINTNGQILPIEPKSFEVE